MFTRFGIIKSLALLGVLAAFPAFADGPTNQPAQKLLSIVQTDKGAVFADEAGFTLYTFDIDQPGQSNCAGPCAVKWPPAPIAADTVVTAPLSVITRADGTKQLAYKDKPLYRFQDDDEMGDTYGDGLNGKWHIVVLP